VSVLVLALTKYQLASLLRAIYFVSSLGQVGEGFGRSTEDWGGMSVCRPLVSQTEYSRLRYVMEEFPMPQTVGRKGEKWLDSRQFMHHCVSSETQHVGPYYRTHGSGVCSTVSASDLSKNSKSALLFQDENKVSRYVWGYVNELGLPTHVSERNLSEYSLTLLRAGNLYTSSVADWVKSIL